jgi:hypothetical protein
MAAGVVEGALSTIAGYEAMHMTQKGQTRWLPKGEVLGQKRCSESWPDFLRQLSPTRFSLGNLPPMGHRCVANPEPRLRRSGTVGPDEPAIG